jgi:cytochrome c oxidase assembly protein subunit 11
MTESTRPAERATPQAHLHSLNRRNNSIAAIFGAVALGMLGLAYAAVPLYQMFCRTTGYGGTVQRVAKPASTVLDRTITIRFDANVTDLAWTFEPVKRTMDVRIGENTVAFYRATNTSDRPLVGAATYNVSPEISGAYFNKLACFCFTEQRLEPGETVDMPVSFYVDPAIMADKDGRQVKQITLSYTFYPVNKPKQAARVVVPAVPANGQGG